VSEQRVAGVLGAHAAEKGGAGEQMARKRTPQELVDDNERTTPIGLFLTAEAYWNGASTLYRSQKRAKRSVLFGDKPTYFCYYHSIELYLKALLRCHHGVDELEKRFGHRAKQLMTRAKELGLPFDDEDVEVLTMMGETDAVIRSRYTRSGFFSWPTLEALNRTCKSLRVSVNAALKKSGVIIEAG
jgi:hypothetical protein